MKLFPSGHATHPQWRMAAALVVAQVRGQMALPEYAFAPTLGVLYITDFYAPEAQELLDYLRDALPEVTDWSGTVGVGVAANNAEYFDEPGLSLLLLDIPPEQYRVFSGVAPLPLHPGSGFRAHTALLHADGHAPDLVDLLQEMSARTESQYLFGGVSASRTRPVQFAAGRRSGGALNGPPGEAPSVFGGGLSGVAFGKEVALVSRVTQGCLPLGERYTITAAKDNVVLELNGRPALDVLLDTLGVSLDADPQPALAKVRATLAGLEWPEEQPLDLRRTGYFGPHTRVRHIVGLDASRRGVALADQVTVHQQLTFCQRNATAARADLMRICAEIREELSPQEWLPTPHVVSADMHTKGASAPARAVNPPALAPDKRICGAIYVSCSGRGGPHFGGPSAEMQIVRHALGDVPLTGFFAGGEIAHHHLYGYTGVLTVFVGSD